MQIDKGQDLAILVFTKEDKERRLLQNFQQVGRLCGVFLSQSLHLVRMPKAHWKKSVLALQWVINLPSFLPSQHAHLEFCYDLEILASFFCSSRKEPNLPREFCYWLPCEVVLEETGFALPGDTHHAPGVGCVRRALRRACCALPRTQDMKWPKGESLCWYCRDSW